jgi:predicted MFS family arabinose efflux permease
MGLFYALTGLTTFIASLLVGVVWDYYGSTAALMIGAGFAILALLGLAIAHRFVRSR